MQKMIRAAMAQDFSWERSTAEYVKLTSERLRTNDDQVKHPERNCVLRTM